MDPKSPGNGLSTGATLPELLVVLALVGIAVAAAFVYVTPAEAPLVSAGSELEGFFRRARASAIATASAYRVRPTADDHVIAEYADRCSAGSWTLDGDLELDLPRGVTLTNTSWSVCFTGRGVANNNLTVDLTHSDFGTDQVEVLLGGLARVLP